MENLKQLELEIIKAVKHTGKLVKEHFGQLSSSDIQLKDDQSLVTFVDKESEKDLVRQLKGLIEDADFLTEEKTVDQSHTNDWQWIIDPIDGTKNFIKTIPHFAISIALRHKGETVVGVIFDIIKNELFHATKGNGAFMNGESISVSTVKNLSKSTVGTASIYNNNEEAKILLKKLYQMMISSQTIRRLGSAALDLCYVANGRFDCYYANNLNDWDVAAGFLIIEEAGGLITDYQMKKVRSEEILASNGIVHQEALQALIKTLN